jgi:hypothetical protein
MPRLRLRLAAERESISRVLPAGPAGGDHPREAMAQGVAYVLVPAGRAPDATLLGWMRQYSTATGTPFLFNLEGRPRGYGSPEFQMEILDKASRGEPLLRQTLVLAGHANWCRRVRGWRALARLALAIPA